MGRALRVVPMVVRRPHVSTAFCCPRCRGALREQDLSFTCESCAQDYPIVNGIVDFRCRRHDYYFNPVPREEMADLVRQAQTIPWDATVRRFLSFVKDVSGWTDNITVNGRYAWKLLLELRPGCRFLDFGCGLGNLTHNIAPHVGEAVALDLTWERLQFAQQRFAKFNPHDRIILVAGGDGAHLPFPDAHFDCIALSGVLEWIADDSSLYENAGTKSATALKMLMSFFGETNPRKTQLRFLRELRRILKPGGQLFVAIENRWAYEYFQGVPDHHSAVAYNSLLPRFIANIYAIVRARQPYRTYTYSFNEFRRLFVAAGFPYQEIYGLTPGYSGMSEIIPAATDQTFWSARRATTWKERVKRNRHFVPAFGVAARDTAGRPVSLLSRVLEEIKGKLGTTDDFSLSECLITGKEKVVLKGSIGDDGVVLKIPVDQRARDGETNNWRLLQILSRGHGLSDIVPKPMASGVYQGVAYFMERAAIGQPMTLAMDTMTRASAATKVLSLLMRMHTPAAGLVSIDETSALYVSLVSEPMAKLKTTGLEPVLRDRLESYLRSEITSRPWAVGLYHGDFTSDNIFVSEREISGVIDWESTTEYGLPALDAIAYVEGAQRVADPHATVTGNLMRLSLWDWPSSEEVDMLKAVYRYFNIDPGAHEFLCRLCWLQHVVGQLHTAVRFEPTFFERWVRPMVATLTNA